MKMFLINYVINVINKLKQVAVKINVTKKKKKKKKGERGERFWPKITQYPL